METGSKKVAKETKTDAQTTSSELSISPLLFQHLFMFLVEYRIKLPIREVMVFPNGNAYYVCPRCSITLEREYVAYCDRCGQHLGWKGYKKARIVYPGSCKKEYT